MYHARLQSDSFFEMKQTFEKTSASVQHILESMYVCVYICMHACMYVMCMYVCMHACMYVCNVYVCMRTCVCAGTVAGLT